MEEKINYNIQLTRYGFYIKFDINLVYCGFYWKATSLNQEECGMIDFMVTGREKELFVETSFTPVLVEVYPIFASSKKMIINYDLIMPGDWILKFTNIKSSSATLQFLGSEKDKYEGFVLGPHVTLEESKVIQVPVKLDFMCEKIFVKKSNYSEQEIEIADIGLINTKNKKIMASDESLIKPEYEHIYRKNGRIIFSSESPIWSFFTIKFYEY